MPESEEKLKKAIKALKNLLESKRNQRIQKYLCELSTTVETNYSLRKVTKRLKCPQTPFPPIRKQDESWARSDEEKAKAFAAYLFKIFEPYPCEITIDEETKLLMNTNTTAKLPLQGLSPSKKCELQSDY